MMQLITPNPNIPCTPGYCLQYVRQAFGLPARYATATAAWEGSNSQHRDRNYPAGVWIPVWYGLDREPAGHVVLLAPDGSVYSTSDNTTTPHHHPSLADLEDYYAGWGWPLTYRGWTEDVAGFPVVSGAGSINVDSINTPQEDYMPLTQDDANLFVQTLLGAKWNTAPKATLGELLNEYRDHHLDVLKTIGQVPSATYNLEVPRGGGGDPINLGTVVSWMESWVIQVLGGIAALKTGAAPADIEAVIKKAIAESIVTVDVKVEGIPKA